MFITIWNTYLYYFKEIRLQYQIKSNQNSGMQVDDMDLPVFDLSTIAKATSNFTIKNKIGEGGFGSVYRVICL